MTESPRTRAQKACDTCRLRKIKCRPCDDASATNMCNPCFTGNLDCTFEMPVKRRGPPPKRRRGMIDAAIAGSEDSQSVPSTSPGVFTPTIQRLCSKAVFEAIMRDYLERIYPLVPVVHCPTFLAHLHEERYMHSQTFLSFCFAISALVLAILPRKLDEYNGIDGSLEFANRQEAIEHIHSMIMQARPVDYFDKLTHEKWAISYLMSMTNAHLRHLPRAKIQIAEADVICTELGLPRISSYVGLDNIEAQLRKKAFWLNFTTFSHVRAHQIQWDSLADRFMFETADADLLMPLEVDDEYITRDGIFLQPPGKTPLVAGFNALTRISNCLVSIIRDHSLPLISCDETVVNPRTVLGTCRCGRHVQPAAISELVQARLRKVKEVVSDLPAELGKWPSSKHSASSEAVLFSQYEGMRANIHATHLWAQSVLLERFITTTSWGQHTRSSSDVESIWEMREDISRQLLHILTNISQVNLEPNGYFVISKARQVAASLLNGPFREGDEVSSRAKFYIDGFAEVLARLDYAYQHGHGVWETVGEQVRASPRAYWSMS